MFLAPYFFRGAHPEFLDLHYKIEPDSNGVAKFDGDRPRELGDLALKKKLDGHGRARREAARRRKSECKISLSPR